MCSMPIAAPFTSTASRLTGESVRYTAKLRSARDPPLRLSTSYRLTAVNQTDTGMVTKPGGCRAQFERPMSGAEKTNASRNLCGGVDTGVPRYITGRGLGPGAALARSPGHRL